jgi:phage shock protein A
MTELERHLTDGLKNLAKQYAQDMQRLEGQNSALQQQVQTLAGQLQGLSKVLDSLNLRLTELVGS